MKALLFTALVLSSFSAQAFFGDMLNPNNNNNNNQACTCQPDNTQINNQNNIALINGNMDVSKNMLELSMALLAQSQMMMTSATSVNEDYVNAMLTLSQDIGTMADHIGEMADRIVKTEELIGDMADRILVTQQLQNQNVAITQQNLLKAQENFNNLLVKLAQ